MVPDFSRVQVKSSLSRGLPRIGKWLGLVELEERGIGLRLGGLSGSIAISLQGRCQGDIGPPCGETRTAEGIHQSALELQPGDQQ